MYRLAHSPNLTCSTTRLATLTSLGRCLACAATPTLGGERQAMLGSFGGTCRG